MSAFQRFSLALGTVLLMCALPAVQLHVGYLCFDSCPDRLPTMLQPLIWYYLLPGLFCIFLSWIIQSFVLLRYRHIVSFLWVFCISLASVGFPITIFHLLNNSSFLLDSAQSIAGVSPHLYPLYVLIAWPLSLMILTSLDAPAQERSSSKST